MFIHSRNKHLLLPLIAAALLAACQPKTDPVPASGVEITPVAETTVEDNSGTVTVDGAVIDNEAPLPIGESLAPVTTKPPVPADDAEATASLAKFEQERTSGQSYYTRDPNATFTQFESDVRLADRYPVWTDLTCQMAVDGARTSWCAFGRMGEADEAEVANAIPFILNQDVIRYQGELKCTQRLCFNVAGQAVGALQPAMWDYMTRHCTLNADGSYSCAS